MFCTYKDIFGAPNTGVHKKKILNIAIVDFVSTILLGLFIYWIIYKYYGIDNYALTMLYIMYCLFVLGIISHRLFCVRTTIDKLLFP